MSKHGTNIYLRKDGRWEGRYIKSRCNGKIQYGYVYSKTYDDVKRKLNINDLSVLPALNTSDSFKNLAEEWLSLKTPQLKTATIVKYNNILNLYLLPRFGNVQITDISRMDILKMSQEL